MILNKPSPPSIKPPSLISPLLLVDLKLNKHPPPPGGEGLNRAFTAQFAISVFMTRTKEIKKNFLNCCSPSNCEIL